MSGVSVAFEARWDVIVVGGGPAGLAAALSAREAGARRVLLLERQDDLGGILNQCIHNGFGLHYFKEELTGPEYAERFICQLEGSGVAVLCGAMVLSVFSGGEVHAIHPQQGYLTLHGGAVVLAMGCRERTRGAIGIPGSRPAGVLSAGAAQLYMNIDGYQIGRRAVVLGSGDIGLIMARRLTLEGAEVLGVYEIMPYSGGLTRNIVQCLDDYGIPLHLQHTITEIRGDKRVEQVVVQKVDDERRPIAGTEQVIDCDTVLLSVGLIPENELSRGAGIPIDKRTGGPLVYENMETQSHGVFACGNVAHVHDLVDFVTAEARRAGAAAAVHAMAAGGEGKGMPTSMPPPAPATGTEATGQGPVAVATTAAQSPATSADGQEVGAMDGARPALMLQNGFGVSYTVPQAIRVARVGEGVDIFFRVRQIFKNVHIELAAGGTVFARFAREHMAPGEMERITLPKIILDKIPDNSAEIRIVPD